jgi:Nbl1 / Borealin N terminal
VSCFPRLIRRGVKEAKEEETRRREQSFTSANNYLCKLFCLHRTLRDSRSHLQLRLHVDLNTSRLNSLSKKVSQDLSSSVYSASTRRHVEITTPQPLSADRQIRAMAPAQNRKRKSEQMEEEANITPTGSPARKKMKITQSQRQALIDNLQLEITDRARGLRAHYALQCADLRARIERRINRIPMALRKANIGELLAKHNLPAQPKAVNTTITTSPKKFGASGITIQGRPMPTVPRSPNTKLPSPIRPVQQPLSSTPRGEKRKTSEIVIAADKDAEAWQQNGEQDNLAVHKNPKRAKTNTGGARNISHSNKPGNVLSPKSHNSRTLPQSPVKDYKYAPSSPSKPSYIARPVSPLKPASPLKNAASAATSAISASFHGMMEHAKRGGNATTSKLTRIASQEKQTATTNTGGKMLPPPRPATVRSASAQSTSSSGSGTSTTTVVKKGTGSRAATKADVGKKMVSGPKTAMKSGATAVSAQGKKVAVAEPAAGRRVLRKRN